MGSKSGAFSRYRPRFFTIVVLFIVAAPIVVANLSRDEVPPRVPQVPPLPNLSYGWPLIWYECEFTRASTGGAQIARMDLNLVQWSGPRLAGNLAIWLAIFAVAGVPCEWLLRRYRPHIRLRPRLVTLIVLLVVAAPIVLANLSEESTPLMMGVLRYPLCGWPLIWRWRNCVVGYGSTTVLDWNYNPARLAGNLATWLVMLAAPGLACEWLLRRYRPRLRWSLRTMLTAVGLLAVLCAWCAALRERANLQDPIIAEYGVNGQGDALFLDRWGPKWLDLVGADRFRRRVVGVELGDADNELLKRLKRLPDLRYLVVRTSDLTPDTAAVLGEIRQLRMLRIEFSSADDATAHACLESVGKLNRLERLCLEGLDIRGDHLASLRGLMNLKSLTLVHEDDVESKQEWLAALGELIQIERLCLQGWDLSSDDLAYLARLTNLKSLTLERYYDSYEIKTHEKTHEWLAALGELIQIERLCLTGFYFRSDDLARLAGLRNLRALGLRDLYWPDSSSDEVGMAMEEDSMAEDSMEEEGESTDELENMYELENTDKPQLLVYLPALPRLETIDLNCSEVGDADLAQLAVLRHLKLLDLTGTAVTDAGLAKLESLESLEELAIDQSIATAVGLESLLGLRRLKALHIGFDALQGTTVPLLFDGERVMYGGLYVREDEVDRCRRALEALRRSNPGIVIDGETDVFNERRAPTTEWEISEDRLDLWVYHNFYGW